jgi:cytochrome c5
MSTHTGLIGGAALSLAALVCLASTGRAQGGDPGEAVVNAACQECHSIRTIQTQALDAAAWEARLRTEIERGARVTEEQIPVAVDYLAFEHGPLPDGPGKDVLLNTCTMCHQLTRIRFAPRSAEEWEETLFAMLNEGAPLSVDEFIRVHAYLATYFGVD